jgi:hypothetical protein
MHDSDRNRLVKKERALLLALGRHGSREGGARRT